MHDCSHASVGGQVRLGPKRCNKFLYVWLNQILDPCLVKLAGHSIIILHVVYLMAHLGIWPTCSFLLANMNLLCLQMYTHVTPRIGKIVSDITTRMDSIHIVGDV